MQPAAEYGPYAEWLGVASSADGRVVCAAAYLSDLTSNAEGFVVLSFDYGLTWNLQFQTNEGYFRTCEVNADGTVAQGVQDGTYETNAFRNGYTYTWNLLPYV